MTYAGLCVGGPMDGKAMVSKTTRLYVEIKPNRPLAVPPPRSSAAASPRIATERFTYLFYNPGQVGIWVPENSDLGTVMNTLLTLYANEAAK